MTKSLGELFSSKILQQAEHDREPDYQGFGMKWLRNILKQRPPEDDHGDVFLNLIREEDRSDLEAIFRETKI